ncbi:MAG TPA: Hsp33 family molecular chaperone HslO [Cellvibrio sp.]|nr:Hsp33 family molecular chaperone HslO [Cellvibrio sp.]
MPSKDLLHRFLFDDCDIRGEIVTLGESYREVLSHNPQQPAIHRLLGEFLAAVGLLTSTLKFEGKIILQARGDGAISTIMAECNHHNNLRGIVRLNSDIELSEELALNGNLQQLLGNGILVITIEPQRNENFGGKIERHQGIVPMDAEHLAGCLEHYFQQSEQLATKMWITANEEFVTGLLIQALPQQLITNEDDNRDKWETIVTLADTVKNDELLLLDHPSVLYRLFNEHPLRLFEPKALRFACSCSRERSANALLSIGKEEVESLLLEKGSIDIDCQFCNQHYHFAADEVRKLLGGEVLH